MAEHMFLCPACGRRSLVAHCRTSMTCRWHKCLDASCGLVADLGRRIGILRTAEGGWVAWHPTPA